MITPVVLNVLLTGLLAQSDPPVDKKCTLEGQVLNAITETPLKRATVTVTAAWHVGLPRRSFTVSTDDQGAFTIKNLDPGTYGLEASRSGYVSQQYGARSPSAQGTPLQLTPAQAPPRLTMKLMPEAMIFGRVIDEDNEPIRGLTVFVSRRLPNRQQPLHAMEQGESQADGSFVVGDLQAGSYFVCAMPRNDPRAGSDELLRTCFPNATSTADASPVQVSAGDRARGIEIRMRRGRLYAIRGSVRFPADAPPDSVIQVSLRGPVGLHDMEWRSGGATSKFEFPGLQPGTYLLFTQPFPINVIDPATAVAKDATYLAGKLEITITDADQEGLVLTLTNGIDLAGRIRIVGDTPNPALLQQISCCNVTLNAEGGQAGAKITPQGAFLFHGLIPDAYRVRLYQLPEGTYLKSVRFNQDDVTGKQFELTPGIRGDLEIVLSSNAADITGVVRNENGDAVPGVNVQTYLGDELKRDAVTDQNGSYHLTGLAPGDYRIYAWEDIERGLAQDPDFRTAFESRAAAVKLEEKSHESIELKLISKDDIETEAAKIR